MNKFVLKNMGCKANQFEGTIIEENLVSNGWIKNDEIKSADFFILNSCTVTHKSDNEALYILRNAKRENPNIKTILTGCIAQVEQKKLLNYEFIDFVIGNDEKLNILDHLSSNFAVSDIMARNIFTPIQVENVNKTRASVKIQDGCDNRCAYCIIPFARGKSRSASIEFIQSQINNFVDNGFKEVVFTGIHIGQWGKDINKTLLELLINVEKNTNIHRYRLGSLNPLEITDDLLAFLATSEKFCPHFHLSLQSACNKTLKAMNRFYTVEMYLEQIEKLTQIFNKPFIGSDIIAGFVGETDEDFSNTIENLKKSKLSQIHTFPYSIRKGTQAEKMNGHLPQKVKDERANIIKEISKEKFNNFLLSNIETNREVLIERRPDKHSGLLKGVSDNYLNVIIENSNDTNLLNTIQQVEFNKIENNKILGSIVL